MNIFRDLVEELKDENLLEETVINPDSEEASTIEEEPVKAETPIEPLSAGTTHPAESEASQLLPGSDPAVKEQAAETTGEPTQESQEQAKDSQFDQQASAPEEPLQSEPAESDKGDEIPAAEIKDQPEPVPAEPKPKLEDWDRKKIRSPEEERKFFRQRAMDEVTGLQLVEHVLTGVEREQMKTVPKPFDDLAVKRSLHDFLKVADDLGSPEHPKAEFQLMQETENWASALSRRDRNISVADLRRYCETTRPTLSSQAMISLARFYRNSPFSESVRSKFDLVFTKLFSKDTGNDKRAVVFKNEDLVKHIQELYADWSSVPLYSTDDDDSELLLAALKFQEFINEANDAETFDALVRRDFFKRLKVFKEGCHENFFAPILIAAAIESNIAVGNRYVELIEQERLMSGATLGDKYGISHDNAISEATSKTLALLDMLRVAKPEPDPEPEPISIEFEAEKPAPVKKTKSEEPAEPRNHFSFAGGANKWLVVATVAIMIVAGWYFLQGTSSLKPAASKASGKAKEFTLSNTPLNKHVHSARISRSTLFCITRETWDSLSKQEKTKFLENALFLGEEGHFSKVHLLNKEGQSVAFASKSQLAIY